MGEKNSSSFCRKRARRARFTWPSVRASMESAKFFAGSPRAVEHLTISVGVAVFDTDVQFKREVIEASDAALYAAKSQGRNQVVLYSDLARRQRKEVS